jgi:serine/threonine-protein kinase
MLEAGNSLAHYRLIEKIGEGGMGEVWKAADERLDREVALKVLPERVTAEPGRLDRFTREAKLLASLNHAGIATIHDVLDHEGVRFLVMELVPGDDLAQELERGPLPVRDALEVALNIARAVEAAHHQGVVHRDLKPANVKRSVGSDVKVLDFGLAKALDPDPSSDEPSVALSPTVTSAGTLAGVILGTAAYMSPEQARGRPVDKRTDVWSFGVLLYELLTGDNPFRGDTVADSVGAIMHRDPDLDALPQETPVAIRRLLRRCLARERSRRLHDIADARIELEEALADPEADLVPAARTGGEGPAPARASKLPWVALALLLPLVALLGWWLGSREAPEAPEAQRRFKLAHDVEVDEAVLSPDAARIAYLVEGELFLRSLDSLEPRPIAIEGDEVNAVFWSPDGRSLGVVRRPSEILRLDLDGGAPLVLTDAVEMVDSAVWADDGYIYYTQFQTGLSRVPEGGGAPETILDPHENMVDYHGMFVLPQGRGYLTIPHLMETDARAIYFEQPGQEPKPLFESDSTIAGLHYSTTGHLLFHRQENPTGLWAIPFSLETTQITGDPYLVLPDLSDVSISTTGDLVYTQSALHSDKRKQQLVWFDHTGQEMDRLDMALYGAGLPVVSPDGTKIALMAGGIGRPATGPPGLWVIDLERGTNTRLTSDRIVPSRPIWNADGTRVAYIEATPAEGGAKNVVSVRADGTGDRQPLFTGDLTFFLALTRDWTAAAFMRGSMQDERGMAIATQRPDDPSSATDFVDGPDHELAPDIHPNGDWITYLSGKVPSLDVMVRPFPEGEGQWKLSRGNAWLAHWSADGTKLYYTERKKPGEGEGDLIEVTFDDSGPTPVFGTPKHLFSVETDDLSVTPDGHFVRIENQEPAEGEEAPDVNGIVFVENWAG